MTPKNKELLERIEAFAFDEPGTSFTFAQRLARENGWTAEYTRRALREYGRFVYLAMEAGHMVCPSEAVDQVWHQHLTFTRNYWDEFCGKVLGKPLHHGPTRGGKQEGIKHHDMYAQTLASYRAEFGEDAPADIWPCARQRFAEGASFVRVNRREVWIIPKPRWLRSAALLGFAAAAPAWMACTPAPALAEIPLLDLPGGKFLAVYIAMIIGAVLAARLMNYFSRVSSLPFKEGQEPADPYLAATLSGGPNLAVYAATAELWRKGLVCAHTANAISAKPGIEPPANLHPFEQAVLRSINGMYTMVEIRGKVALETGAMEEILRREDMVLSKARQDANFRRICWLFAAVFAIGIAKLLVGMVRERPVGYLVVVLLLSGLFFFCVRKRAYRSTRGDSALKALRHKHTREMMKMHVSEDAKEIGAGFLPLAVGLWGLPILAGTEFTYLQNTLVPDAERSMVNSGTGCSSGCSTGCGGGSSGCGGGSSGCGGCGGGGD